MKKHCAGILHPGPAQVRLERPNVGLEVRCGPYLRVMDRNSGVLIWVISTLGRDHIDLALQWPSYIYHAILEYNCSISKYKVYCAIDVAFSIELALGMDHEGVLVTLDGTPVEDGEIRG